MRVALTAVLLALVPAAGAAPLERPPIVVSNYADDGSPGTFRHAIEEAAQPGDTIRFANAVRLVLRANLIVPKRLAGLTIDGATPGGGRVTLYGARVGSQSAQLDVLADSVAVRNVTFGNLPVSFRPAAGADDGPEGAQVVDNTFVFDHSYPRAAALGLTATTGARVEANRFEAGPGGGMLTSRTERTTIVRNVFDTGLRGDDDRQLTVERNTGTATFHLDQIVGGTIARNTLTGSKARIAASDTLEDALLRVVGNEVEVGRHRTGLVVAATSRVEVRGNTVRGIEQFSTGMTIACREQRPGTAVVAGNRAEGLLRGIVVDCSKPEGRFVVEENTVRANRGVGIVVRAHDARLRANTVERNGAGIVVERRARLLGDLVRNNRGAGVLVRRRAQAQILNLRAGGNGGRGIHVSGESPPQPEAKHDARSGRLRGTACPRCLVQVYESEDGAKQGNPRRGEGVRAIASVRADAAGRWSRRVSCPKTATVTLTATRDGVTSEFSADVACGCLAAHAFAVSGAGTPRTGSRTFGLRIAFPKGSRPERATLVDVVTGERPAADALGPLLTWTEEQRDVTPSPAGVLTRDYLVAVRYRPGETGFALSRRLWRFSVAYEPPRGAGGCSARVAELAPRVSP